MKQIRLKRVFAAFMAAAMVMGLAACSGNKDAAQDTQDTETVASGTAVTEAEYLNMLDQMNEYVEQVRRDSVNTAQPGELPEGELAEGEAPADMPQGGAPDEELPEGEAPQGETPENMPEGQVPDGAAPNDGNSEMVTFFTNMLTVTAPEGYEDIQVSAQAISNAMLEYFDASANLAGETDEAARAELEETMTTALNTAITNQVEVLQAMNAMSAATAQEESAE